MAASQKIFVSVLAMLAMLLSQVGAKRAAMPVVHELNDDNFEHTT